MKNNQDYPSKPTKYFIDIYNTEIGDELNILVSKLPNKFKLLIGLSSDLFNSYYRNIILMRYYSNKLTATENRGYRITRGKYKKDMMSNLKLLRKVQSLFPEFIKQKDLKDLNLSIFRESPKILVEKVFSSANLKNVTKRQRYFATETTRDINSLVNKISSNEKIDINKLCTALNQASQSLLKIDYYSDESFVQESLSKIQKVILLSLELLVLMILALAAGQPLVHVLFLIRATWISVELFDLLDDNF